ncbi:putative phosphate transport system substrate binding protein precursor [Sphingobium sp. SYK-6]|uniref:substrate-binding domain-containing protein n=1 Tax=Sphingobium sp. (strain NBRC 103272 / SYK-6) TaxID=627192 RepID=UPI0002276CEA|nr:substrate-binding domain-containing protein [Sphingobium sp. SYK-6]BAK65568.1 putative phosphate transport system substrate binding protein precursor [Sphingobium sp. SYK-6]
MRYAILTASLLVLAGCQGQPGSGAARDQIRAVGSSTVYPFAQEAVGLFTQTNPGMKAPIIESTGTGAGMKLFCAGVGSQYPDIENASRRMKKSEFDQCQANGVKEIVEVQIGVDGIAFAESNKGPGYGLTPKLVYEALAANPYGKGPNKAKTWKDVDPSLPAVAISVFGPPSTSGTRDSLAELVLTVGCDSDPAMKALKDSDEARHKQLCTQIREDGAYVDAGENDNLIVQKLAANPDAVGVFGFSYLDANRDKLNDIPLDGVEATYDAVASGAYPGARPLYIYVKKAHIAAVPGLKAYVEAFSRNWNPGGPLTRRGMVAAQDSVRQANVDVVTNLTVMTGDDLK